MRGNGRERERKNIEKRTFRSKKILKFPEKKRTKEKRIWEICLKEMRGEIMKELKRRRE